MKVRSDIKTENEQKLLLIWKGFFLLDAPLFTLKFFIVLKSRVARKNQTLAQGAGRRGGKTPFHIRSNFCSFSVLMSLLTFISKNLFFFI